jgi:glycosyltransferase involved in cell wall biosynthesis
MTSTQPKITVIICTHNPRPDYLERALDALRKQTLPFSGWELLIIDNASTELLRDRVNIFWHPNSRHIREEQLGLTPARLRGISEAKAGLLVFVDDDNVLAADYLEKACQISQRFPILGAWGGSCCPEFEVPPDPSLASFLEALGLREVTKAKWSNYDLGSAPIGAGLCVRAAVARCYARNVATSPIRVALDRCGTSLMGGGDFDLAMTSRELGYGVGLFPELRLTHLISKQRVQSDYLYRICADSTTAVHVIRYLHTGEMPLQPSFKRRTFDHLRKYFAITSSARQRATGRRCSAEALSTALEWIRRINTVGNDAASILDAGRARR